MAELVESRTQSSHTQKVVDVHRDTQLASFRFDREMEVDCGSMTKGDVCMAQERLHVCGFV
jgi:hypothetical protein